MRNLSVKKLTLAGVMAALVFVMTCIPKVPVGYGYIHLGDAAVFLSAMLLGPLSIPAAAIGSGLADILSGCPVYALPTMVIKACMALLVWKGWKKGSWLQTAAALVLAEVVMAVGYFAFEWVMYGKAAALAAVGPNVIQGIAGVALGMVCHGLQPRMHRIVK